MLPPGALLRFSPYRAKELGPRRIAVSAVASGIIATDFNGRMAIQNSRGQLEEKRGSLVKFRSCCIQ